MTDNSFEIKLAQFEGPFDLLLFFIERDELDIHDIAIAKITDDFLNYIHQMNSLNMELASEFIYVAATLMRIKAKMLLPRYAVEEDGELDPKAELIRKLVEYKKFKLICEEMRPMEEERLKQEKRGNITFDLQQVGVQHLSRRQILAPDPARHFGCRQEADLRTSWFLILRVCRHSRHCQSFTTREHAPPPSVHEV